MLKSVINYIFQALPKIQLVVQFIAVAANWVAKAVQVKLSLRISFADAAPAILEHLVYKLE